MIKLGTYPFVTTFKEPQQLQDYADKLCSDEKRIFMLGVMMTTNLVSYMQREEDKDEQYKV
jgi:hypothetical protein